MQLKAQLCMQDRPDPMDIVALAAVELVTLRTRFQACLAELHASNGCRAPPTLTGLIRAASRTASLAIPPEPESSSLQPNMGPSSPHVPRLNLDGPGASPLGPSASGVLADAAAAESGAGSGMGAHGTGHGNSNRAEGGAGGGKSGVGVEQGQVEMMVEREREANAAIKQLKTEWRDERIQHDQQASIARTSSACFTGWTTHRCSPCTCMKNVLSKTPSHHECPPEKDLPLCHADISAQ